MKKNGLFANIPLFDTGKNSEDNDSSDDPDERSPSLTRHDRYPVDQKVSLDDLLSNLNNEMMNVKQETLTRNDLQSLTKTISLLATMREELSEQNFNNRQPVFETFKDKDQDEFDNTDLILREHLLQSRQAEPQRSLEIKPTGVFGNNNFESEGTEDNTALLLDNQKLRVQNKNLREMVFQKENKILNLEEKIVQLEKQLIECKLAQSSMQRRVPATSVIAQTKEKYPVNTYSNLHKPVKKK